MKSKKAANIAASFRARLLNLSRERNEDFQFVLGRWMIERLLYRLSVSPHKENYVLKGAILFAAWTGKAYRPTRDLDLLGWGSPDVERLVVEFREVSMIDGGDGLAFETSRIEGERIKEDAEYEGVRIGIPASLDGARMLLRVDVGFGDAVEPPPGELTFPVLLPAAAPRLRAYPPEAVVADQPFAFTPEFLEDGTKRAQWRAFIKRIGLPTDLTLAQAGERIREFLLPVLEAALTESPISRRWQPGGPWR
jgi:hypothetical protein